MEAVSFPTHSFKVLLLQLFRALKNICLSALADFLTGLTGHCFDPLFFTVLFSYRPLLATVCHDHESGGNKEMTGKAKKSEMSEMLEQTLKLRLFVLPCML